MYFQKLHAAKHMPSDVFDELSHLPSRIEKLSGPLDVARVFVVNSFEGPAVVRRAVYPLIIHAIVIPAITNARETIKQ